MQIAAYHLQKLQFEVTTFSNPLLELKTWFPSANILTSPKIEDFLSFDALLLQNNNTPYSEQIRKLPLPVYTFFRTFQPHKHGIQTDRDIVFDKNKSFASNILEKIQQLFPSPSPSLENGICPPSHLTYQKYAHRIAIHPFSSYSKKNWNENSYLKLKDKLLKLGWDPVLIAPPGQGQTWESPSLDTLSDLASFLYESGFFIGNDSGPGHLASNLKIPTLTIGESFEHLSYWRPSWHHGTLAHLPPIASKIKLFKNNWNNLITLNKVYKRFTELTRIK